MISAPSAFTTANAALAKQPIYLIEIDGYSRSFTNHATGVSGQVDWLEAIDDHSITVSDLDGGSTLGELSFTVQDRGRAITADFPSFVFEGKKVVLKTGFVGMSQADFCILFTGKVDAVAGANGNNSYTFTCTDNKECLTQVIYTAGDDGQPTDSDHTRTLNGHPLDMLLAILRNEIGLSDDEIGVTKIERYRDEIFAGVQFYFSIDSPPEAREFIEQQLLTPLGGYLWVNNLGQIQVNFFYPLADLMVAVLALNPDNLIEVPEPEQADLINTVSYRFDKFSDKFMAESVEIFGPSEAKYGLYGQQVIEAEGVRSSFQGYALAAMTSRSIFMRYGDKNPKFQVSALWSACVLEPGDLVLLTHPQVPDRKAGVLGVTGWLMQVGDRGWNFSEGICQPTLIDATSLQAYGRYKIAPDAVPDWTAATSDQQDRYMFVSDALGKYSDGADAHQLG